MHESQETTILADWTSTTEAHWQDQKPWVKPSVLDEILGWELKPEGLCQGSLCIPVPDAASLMASDGLDLIAAAEKLNRPTLVDSENQWVVIGSPAEKRENALVGRQVPNVTLRDLDGASRELTEWSGTRRLLVAFSSW
ncbi:MAG: hypothetical protein HOC65_04700 [Actinobacteria bacterium]|nr:hypothetical protein [Actinomycetota bacterium]